MVCSMCTDIFVQWDIKIKCLCWMSTYFIENLHSIEFPTRWKYCLPSVFVCIMTLCRQVFTFWSRAIFHLHFVRGKLKWWRFSFGSNFTSNGNKRVQVVVQSKFVHLAVFYFTFSTLWVHHLSLHPKQNKLLLNFNASLMRHIIPMSEKR